MKRSKASIEKQKRSIAAKKALENQIQVPVNLEAAEREMIGVSEKARRMPQVVRRTTEYLYDTGEVSLEVHTFPLSQEN